MSPGPSVALIAFGTTEVRKFFSIKSSLMVLSASVSEADLANTSIRDVLLNAGLTWFNAG